MIVCTPAITVHAFTKGSRAQKGQKGKETEELEEEQKKRKEKKDKNKTIKGVLQFPSIHPILFNSHYSRPLITHDDSQLAKFPTQPSQPAPNNLKKRKEKKSKEEGTTTHK